MLLKSSCVTPVDCRATHKRVEASPDHMAKARTRLDTLGIHSIESAGKNNTTVPAHTEFYRAAIYMFLSSRGVYEPAMKERERGRFSKKKKLRLIIFYKEGPRSE